MTTRQEITRTMIGSSMISSSMIGKRATNRLMINPRSGDQRGLAPAIELVVLVPVLLILLGLAVAGGRIWFVRSAITEAAYSGARAASIERDAGTARNAGEAAAIAQLQTDGVDCADRSVVVDVSGFAAPVGQPAAVNGAIHCRIRFADVLLPGFPGSLQLTGHASSAIDTYRER